MEDCEFPPDFQFMQSLKDEKTFMGLDAQPEESDNLLDRFYDVIGKEEGNLI